MDEGFDLNVSKEVSGTSIEKEQEENSVADKKPKKKKHGCLIAFLIVLGVIIVGIIVIVARISYISSPKFYLKTAEEDMEKEEYDNVINFAEKVVEDYDNEEQLNKAQELINQATAKKAEKEAAEAESRKAEIQGAIQITNLWLVGPDSADGFELHITFINKSQKTIKYLTFGASLYNAVGDIVTCKYKKANVNYCEETGPYGPGEGKGDDGYYWGKFYNSTITSVRLVSLDIEYTDGTHLKTNSEAEAQMAMY